MDHWDPAVTDGVAQDRPVVLFDNAGVAATTGDTPNTIEAMADHAVAFVGALGLSQVDVLGFSIGGYVAQTLALRHRTLVRRMILVATAPRGGDPSQDPHAAEYAASTDPITGESSLDAFLYLFFRPTATSQAAGRAFWERRHERKRDVDHPSTLQTMAAQRAAATEWRQIRGERFSELKDISQPTLVVNGHHDVMIPTLNSLHALAAHSARAIDHLPGFRPRRPLSISRVVRGTWPHVSRGFLKGQEPLMPMIDVYAPNDLLPSGSDRRIGEALTLAALRAEGVAAPSPYYLENTGALIHRMDPATVQTAAEPLARAVRIQIITPPGALTRDAQKQLVKDATGIMADICGDPSLANRTWVLLTEAAEGGWGIGGTAFGREEFTP
jgi:pimeloyl-ACP methyl ester carboxylesterase/phenylpyruvate tautomerase PptA (4-oxalocrotonate tautomerase family)